MGFDELVPKQKPNTYATSGKSIASHKSTGRKTTNFIEQNTHTHINTRSFAFHPQTQTIPSMGKRIWGEQQQLGRDFVLVKSRRAWAKKKHKNQPTPRRQVRKKSEENRLIRWRCFRSPVLLLSRVPRPTKLVAGFRMLFGRFADRFAA